MWYTSHATNRPAIIHLASEVVVILEENVVHQHQTNMICNGIESFRNGKIKSSITIKMTGDYEQIS